MSKILITAKISPDLDGLACAFAYAKLLNKIDKDNKYVAGVYGEAHIEARYLIERFNIKEGLVLNPEIKFDKFILVDASDLKGMPEIIRAEDVIEVIDHRKTHRANELFPNAKIQVEKVGAAATLIFEKYIEHGLNLDKNSVYLLLGAIYSNTLNFLSDIVSVRDKEAAHSLINNGVKIPADLIEKMFSFKSDYIKNNLEKSILGDFKDFDNGLGIAQLEGYDLVSIVSEKINEIKIILTSLKEKYKLKYIFLTAIDLKNNYNIFVVIDEKTKILLEPLNLVFNDKGIAKNTKLILRKQIMPLLIGKL